MTRIFLLLMLNIYSKQKGLRDFTQSFFDPVMTIGEESDYTLLAGLPRIMLSYPHRT